MVELDGKDIEILLRMYEYGPTMGELRHIASNVEKRAYRMSRHKLCAGDRAGMHPGEPRCWSASPWGEALVEAVVDTEWYDCGSFRCAIDTPLTNEKVAAGELLIQFERDRGVCFRGKGFCTSACCRNWREYSPED